MNFTARRNSHKREKPQAGKQQQMLRLNNEMLSLNREMLRIHAFQHASLFSFTKFTFRREN